MSMTVKAYLMKPDEANSEIRRFAVDQDVTTNFAYLKEKVTQMFPALKYKTIQLFWKDTENDLIAFSSDDELTEALGFVTDGIFKIYIQELEGVAPEPDLPKGMHPGVVCDGCEGPVIGDRFKCEVCPDYDLCSDCKTKGLHPEHEMGRIEARPFPGGYMAFGFPWHGHGHPPPPGPHHPHGHHPPPHGHPPPPPFAFWGPGGRGGRHNFRKMMKKCWKGWMGEETDDCKAKKQGANDEAKKQGAYDKKSADAEPKEPSPEGAANQSDSSGEEFGENEEYLRNIGEQVAQMLDPLGIDVDIGVEHHGKRRTRNRGRGIGRGRGSCPAGGYGPWGWAWGTGGRGCGWGSGRPSGRRCPAEQKPEESSEKKQADVEKQQPDVEMETGEAENNAQQAFKATDTMEAQQASKATDTMDAQQASKATDTMEMEEQVPSSEEVQAPSSNAETGEGLAQKTDDRETSPNREWTLLDAVVDSETQASGENLYPEVPQPPQPTPPSNPAVANALDHMMAMGFGDEGGWLTHLLEVTGGDINKALDAIRANRSK